MELLSRIAQDPLLGTWAERLWRASWQAALCALAVLLLTRAVPRLSPALRAGLWWFVSLKVLVDVVGLAPVALPLLPPEPQARAVARAAPQPALVLEQPVLLTGVPVVTASGGQGLAPGLTGARLRAPAAPAVQEAPRAVPVRERLEVLAPWLGRLLLGAWLLGVALHLSRLVRGWAQVRALRAGAQPLEDARLQRAAEELSAGLGLLRAPSLQVARGVQSPLAVGLLRPAVILPPRLLAGLSAQEQRMALAHELAHLRRRDLWLGWVPALAQALFFFHPLVRRAGREYALAREEACDAEALQATGAAPAEYGRLLLAFGVARPHGALAALGASAHLHALKRRLHMLENAEVGSRQVRRWMKTLLCGAGLLVLVPFQVVARQAPESAKAPQGAKAREAAKAPEAERVEAVAPRASAPPVPAVAPPASAAPAPAAAVPAVAPPASAAPAAARPAVAPPASAAPAAVAAPAAPAAPAPMAVARAEPPPAPAAPATPRMSATSRTSATPRTPLPPRTPVTPHVAPTPPVPPVPPTPGMHGALSLHGGSSEEAYALVKGNTWHMNGDGGDMRAVRRLQKKYPGEFLYVRRADTHYVIRDATTLQAARAALEPQHKLGQEQGELGRKQGELGVKQGELGQKQGALGMKQAELGLEHARLAQRFAGRGGDGEAAEREQERLERELEQRQEALEREQEALGKQQEALARQQEALGRQQEALGERQERLQEESGKKLKQVLDAAVAQGKAEQVQP